MNGNAWLQRLRLPLALALFVAVALVSASPALAVFFGPAAGPSIQAVGVAPTSISVSVADPTIEMSDVTFATAVTMPVGSNPTVTWLSSDESIALVDRYSGVVTPVGLGRAAIVATSVDFSGGAVSGSAMVEVVPTPVTSIDVRWSDGTESVERNLVKGESLQAYVASVLPESATDSSYMWLSGDQDVATVDESGNITGASDGAARIFALANDGSQVAGWVDVVVYTPITDIGIRYGEGDWYGEITDSQLGYPSAVITPSDATIQDVTWSWMSSYYSNYASIDPATGVITPIQGSFRDSVHLHPVATVVGGGRDGANVTNSDWGCIDIYQTYISMMDVSLSTGSITMLETAQASVDIYPSAASFKTYDWVSGDTNVVTVDSEGVITPVGPGSTSITAEATDGSGTWDWEYITVEPIDVLDIDVSWDGEGTEDLRLGKGDSAEVGYVYISPESATYQDVTWSSSNDNVATVDEYGVVTATGNGSATITATTTDGTELSDSVTVGVFTYAESVDVYGNDEWGVSLRDTETAYAYATVYPADAAFQDVTWSLMSPWDYNYAMIDSATGLITPFQGSFNERVHIHAVATVEGGGRYGEDISGYVCVDIYQTMVESIDVTLDDTAMLYGTTGLAARATVYPSDASDISYTWSTSDPSVATIDADGIVTAHAGGVVDIIATANDSNGAWGSASLTVIEPVTSVDVSISDDVMERGDQQYAMAEVGRATASKRGVYWWSSDPDVLTVDSETGLVTAVGKGYADIYGASWDQPEIFDSVRVNVVVTVTGVDVTLSDYDITMRDTAQASAALTPVDPTVETVSWSSSDDSVATVDSMTGLVTPVGVGEADITAQAMDGSGVTGSARITVSPILLESIRVSVDNSDIGVSESTLAVATVLPEDATDKSVVWSSSDETVASVDQDGNVTGISEGYAYIIAVAADGREIGDAVEIHVHNILVDSIVVWADPAEVPVGGSIEAFARVAPKNATDQSVSWTSADPSIANVGEDGVITGMSEGTVRIIVTANDEGAVARYMYVRVTAESMVESVAVELDPSEVTVGEPSQATATVLPLDAWTTAVVWSSSDESVATIDESGAITTLAPGEVTITATSAGYDVSGVSAAGIAPAEVFGSAVLTVNPLPPVLVESLAVSVADNTLTGGQTSQASAVALPANAADKSVEWASSDSAVATVDADGLVTAVAEGQVTITATAKDGSGCTDAETITVYAKPAAMVIATPWLSVTTPRPGTKFYIRSTMSPAHNAGTAGVYAKIQRKRADGTWSSISSIRLGTYYSTVDRSIIRGIATVPSRGTYRVRLSYAGSPAYVTAWKTFTAR